MAENPHFRELLQLLNDFEVRYMVVGGYAVMKYTEPRYTKNLDLWVENSPENTLSLFGALKQFGAPLESDNITPETFTHSGITYQIGIAPIRIDVLTQITGVDFSEAWKRRVMGRMFGIPVPFISLDDLIANKSAIGRRSDLDQLRQISKELESGKQD